MNPSRRKFLQLAAATTALPAVTRIARAQSYPSRPIKLVIPFPPGGVSDAIGRPWAEKMKAHLGTVVIENIGGASGTTGVAGVARARPDGYTLVLANAGNMVVVPVATTRLSYDPLRDFEPIYNLAAGVGVIAVHPSTPLPTLQALLDYAKANPGKLSYGSPGVGTANHLAAEGFKSRTGTSDIVHVPYRGSGPLLSDLIGGQIPIASLSLTGQVLELYKAGKIRILAVLSPTRARSAPELPTTAELGIPDVPWLSFFGLFAPKETPRAIIEKIASATRQAMSEQDLQQFYITSGFEPDFESGPAAYRQFVEERLVKWSPIIKTMELKLE